MNYRVNKFYYIPVRIYEGWTSVALTEKSILHSHFYHPVTPRLLHRVYTLRKTEPSPFRKVSYTKSGDPLPSPLPVGDHKLIDLVPSRLQKTFHGLLFIKSDRSGIYQNGGSDIFVSVHSSPETCIHILVKQNRTNKESPGSPTESCVGVVLSPFWKFGFLANPTTPTVPGSSRYEGNFQIPSEKATEKGRGPPTGVRNHKEPNLWTFVLRHRDGNNSAPQGAHRHTETGVKGKIIPMVSNLILDGINSYWSKIELM